jgi:site-specific DNA-methyltransferase (adenine-specific)
MTDNIQIYNGDCLEILDGLRLQGVDFNNVIFVSDPPFNIGYHYNEYNDNLLEDEYYFWLQNIFGNYKKVIIHYPEELYKFAFQVGEFPERIVSWVYNSNTAKQHRDIAFFGVKPDFRGVGQPYKNPTDKRIAKRIAEGKTARLYDWWEINQVKNVSKKHTHPCVMPEKVMENIIGLLPKDSIIIDPFMGSGTTILAAKKLNREAIGIEISEEYFNIAKKRLLDTPINTL